MQPLFGTGSCSNEASTTFNQIYESSQTRSHLNSNQSAYHQLIFTTFISTKMARLGGSPKSFHDEWEESSQDSQVVSNTICQIPSPQKSPKTNQTLCPLVGIRNPLHPWIIRSRPSHFVESTGLPGLPGKKPGDFPGLPSSHFFNQATRCHEHRLAPDTSWVDGCLETKGFIRSR